VDRKRHNRACKLFKFVSMFLTISGGKQIRERGEQWPAVCISNEILCIRPAVVHTARRPRPGGRYAHGRRPVVMHTFVLINLSLVIQITTYIKWGSVDDGCCYDYYHCY